MDPVEPRHHYVLSLSLPCASSARMERNSVIEQFLSVFPAQSAHTATQFLDASAWDLAAAVESILSGHSGDDRAPAIPRGRRSKRGRTEDETSDWRSQRLKSLYRPPLELLYKGSFEQAKLEGCVQKKWVLANLLSMREFDSHFLNRDTWANDAVASIIPSHFIFWQEEEDNGEGKKVRSYYKINSLPAVLVIDPITGLKMRCWKGMVDPQKLLEDLMPFIEKSPFKYFRQASQEKALLKMKNRETEELSPPLCIDEEEEDKESEMRKRATYPILPEEPEAERSLLCRIAVRLPDGTKLQRNFLHTDPVQLLWSFCDSLMEEKDRPFQLNLAIPGSPLILDYRSNLTFHESKLSNSLISIIWE